MLKLGADTAVASSHVRLLGVDISLDLSVDRHVSRVCAGCFYRLRQLWRIRRSLDFHLAGHAHLLAVLRFRLNIYGGCRAFSVAGPMAWILLPHFIRDPSSSTDCFRRLLKTYLFARY